MELDDNFVSLDLATVFCRFLVALLTFFHIFVSLARITKLDIGTYSPHRSPRQLFSSSLPSNVTLSVYRNVFTFGLVLCALDHFSLFASFSMELLHC